MSRDKKNKGACVILTFATDRLPDKVSVGCNVYSVRASILNPQRCYNCGHSSARCGKLCICDHFGQGKHDVDACSNAPYCLNCKGSHPANSRDCPTFWEEKSIVIFKTQK